jgi:hypothetical protein
MKKYNKEELREYYSNSEISLAYDYGERLKARNEDLRLRSMKALFMKQIALRGLKIKNIGRD